MTPLDRPTAKLSVDIWAMESTVNPTWTVDTCLVGLNTLGGVDFKALGFFALLSIFCWGWSLPSSSISCGSVSLHIWHPILKELLKIINEVTNTY